MKRNFLQLIAIVRRFLLKDINKILKEPKVLIEVSADADYNRYMVSYREKLTVFGKVKVTKFKPILMNDAFTTDIEELLADRVTAKECAFYIDTRNLLMETMPSLTNSDFDKHITLHDIRRDKVELFIKEMLSSSSNIIHIFKHWLRDQIDNGRITDIDGYVFVNTDSLVKNCEPGDFIYKYFDSWQKAASVDLVEPLSSTRALAKMLMTKIMSDMWGVKHDNIFTPVNTLMRDDMAECALDGLDLRRMTYKPTPTKVSDILKEDFDKSIENVEFMESRDFTSMSSLLAAHG